MKMLINLTFFLLLTSAGCFAQSKQEVDKLLGDIYKTGNSKNIITNASTKKLKAYGSKLLPTITTYFGDTSTTGIRSDCQDRFLNKGEVAIIMADHIEPMPYYTVTGIQNCILDYCKGNPNLIEYYLWAIKRDGVLLFQKRYTIWLSSADRQTWPPYTHNKKRNKV